MNKEQGNVSSSESADGSVAGREIDGREDQSMPMVTFSAFVLSIASSALVHLGEVPDPESGQTTRNLNVAKHNIDILSMLRDKTSGNLDADEMRLIEAVLYELRLKYVMADK